MLQGQGEQIRYCCLRAHRFAVSIMSAVVLDTKANYIFRLQMFSCVRTQEKLMKLSSWRTHSRCCKIPAGMVISLISRLQIFSCVHTQNDIFKVLHNTCRDGDLLVSQAHDQRVGACVAACHWRRREQAQRLLEACLGVLQLQEVCGLKIFSFYIMHLHAQKHTKGVAPLARVL